MRVKTLLVLLAAVVLLAAAVTVVVVVKPFAGSSAADDGTYAYTTERELVVMRDRTVVSRVSRIFDLADPMHDKVVWTDDGQRVAVLSDTAIRQEDPQETELLWVDVRSGEQHRSPCPHCDDLAAAGGSSLLLMTWESESRSTFTTLDLADPAHPTPVAFPPAADSSYLRMFLTSGGGRLLTRQGVSGQRNTYFQRVELVRIGDPEGVAVGRFESNDYPVATASSGGDGGFAVAFRPAPGECVADFPVYLVDTAGHATKTDLSQAYPPGYVRGTQGGIEVHDLWWGRENRLYATISSWTCDEGKQAEDEKQVPVRPSSVWRLDGNRWVPDAGEGVTSAREIGPARMELAVPSCTGPRPPGADTDPAYCRTGPLYRAEDGRRDLVADHVLALSAPPRG
ncbi:hypothetical protein FHX82_003842 [Amycolatopsis bartoniae]|uniref:Uncharacterized protein n=1 Tax=Amycolatopsis bartoniae TaxID=941986 RepID=A0A8H9MD79_9PSEU|nr:hypothetical protein [Amycolatopsis bartoniae]MBB2936778.1 hypothetical protein [Amycolatopsis bartoniae]TVT09174.1 hypothetical protein FNH07_09755 [Amycolatopsis bartoniae]GHF50059.1 hypothetical protein GCM10017566_23930 [Amycolatopsis bartoniae]